MEQQKTRRTLKYEFTPAEMLDLGRDLSAKNQELRQIEEQKKSVVAEYGSRIAIAKEQISSLSDKVASGYEMREVTVMIDYHLPVRGKKTLTRIDTGEQWEEPMNDTDHNLFNQWEQREAENAQAEENEETELEAEPIISSTDKAAPAVSKPRNVSGQFTQKNA